MLSHTLTRSLWLSSVALAFTASASAQTADSQRPAATKQIAAKPAAAKPAASRRLDFVPSHSVKEATTRSAPNPSQPAQTSGKQGSDCGSKGMDA